jgi:CheY-like chemotaxis protein
MNCQLLETDDENVTRGLLHLMLGPFGFRVSGVKDGWEILEKIKHGRIS